MNNGAIALVLISTMVKLCSHVECTLCHLYGFMQLPTLVMHKQVHFRIACVAFHVLSQILHVIAAQFMMCYKITSHVCYFS
jgi:hypothetical protein